MRPWLFFVLLVVAAGCGARRTAPPPPPARLQQATRAMDNATKLLRQENWKAAADAWRGLLDEFRLLNDDPHEALALHNLARAERELGSTDAAQRLLEEAAQLNERANQRGPWWRNQIALAQLEGQMGRNDARHTRLEALAARAPADLAADPEARGLYFNELGLSRKATGDFAAALAAYASAEEAFQRAHAAHGLAAVAANRAQCHLAQNELAAARDAWRVARRRYEQLAEPRGIARSLAGEGEALLALNSELPLAAQRLRRASDNFRQLKATAEREAALVLLERAFRALGDESAAAAVRAEQAGEALLR